MSPANIERTKSVCQLLRDARLILAAMINRTPMLDCDLSICSQSALSITEAEATLLSVLEQQPCEVSR